MVYLPAGARPPTNCSFARNLIRKMVIRYSFSHHCAASQLRSYLFLHISCFQNPPLTPPKALTGRNEGPILEINKLPKRSWWNQNSAGPITKFRLSFHPPSAFLPPKTHQRDPYCWWLRNLANQLRLVVSPNSYRVWYIPGGDRRISEQSTVPFPYFKKILMGVAWEPRIGGLAVPRAWGVLWIHFPLSFSSAISHPRILSTIPEIFGSSPNEVGKYHWPDVAGRDQLIIPSATQSEIISFWFCGRTNHQIPSLSKFLSLVPGVQYCIVQKRFSILASAKPALFRLSRISAKIFEELGPNSVRKFTTLISTMSSPACFQPIIHTMVTLHGA